MLTDDDGCGANVCCEYRPTVTIYIGDKEQRIPQSDSLPHIWGTGLDSPCHACGRGFVQEADPTIRTIGFETSQSAQPSVVDFTPAPLAPHPIRIFYRHFSCIQANSIDYVPVSHAWHELVSCAQMERRTNAEVAGLVYQTPVLSLLALTKKHGPTEIWHDYLSVLQWQRNVQRQLLLKIPTIYSFPGTMMIHLDDRLKKGLLATTNSRWFERMWVTLEYLQSKEVAILTEDLICDYNAWSHSAQLDDTVTPHIKRIGNAKFFNDLAAIGCKWRIKVSWSDMEVWKNYRNKHHTLGGAIYIMSSKKCREPADYYFALAGMIEYPLGHILPRDLDGRTPWLRGYTVMSELLWDFGVCHCKANHLDIVRHGKIEPKVESVGVIEAWDYMTFTEDTREYLYFLSSRILRSSGTSASEFCHALDRVLTPLDRKALYTKWNTSFRSARKLLESSSDPEQLEAKLDELVALECIAQTTKSRAPAIMEDIDTMLKLEYSETNCKDNRKDITRAETEWYYTKHGRPMEGVARNARDRKPERERDEVEALEHQNASLVVEVAALREAVPGESRHLHDSVRPLRAENEELHKKLSLVDEFVSH
ncbi:hypothetical protein S40285_09032 [Stachybotrys chlorohalonatus IBT 40285]|uniref:Heterokaryon incompatibility domain-containing protein n=1 Tax=Stachybotrys chlorohalonatus (strain IBT 40285) TaxID=1283841 RepID=A0A084QV59_STAC4|nr:hypothetical protein S40285_09032 [Stachybotrys chlorohalonata IBT 40285]